MSFLVEPPPLPVPAFHDEELAQLNADFEHWSAPKIIQWAVDNFAPHLCMAASMQDAVLNLIRVSLRDHQRFGRTINEGGGLGANTTGPYGARIIQIGARLEF